MRLVEYAPGQFARHGEVRRGQGRPWIFSSGRWARVGICMGDTEKPPELVDRVGDPSLYGRFRSGR